MADGDNFVYMKSSSGKEFAVGETHRFYAITGANDDMAILVPVGARFFAILDPVEALAYEVHSAAVAGVEALDSRRNLVADDESPLRSVKPGEFINISHSDGATAIGVFTLLLEGGDSLPRGTSELTITDPGA